MTNEKKLIFVTSDEDLVRQISLKKTKNTHIIDLDTGKQIIPTNSSKPIKTSKKTTNSICIICGDHAIGYNYDVLSCASCKAFFHRYAHEKLERIKCLTGKNQCVIKYQTDRRCIRCRLKKCLSMGMRKDFILGQQRRKQSEKNESISNTEFDEIDQLLLNINENDINNVLNENLDLNEIEDILIKPLTHEDLIIIQTVQSSFLSIFDNQSESIPESIDLSDQASAIISWAKSDSEIALQTIRFFRQINEFENLNSNDRFILIKYNLFPLMLIRKSYNYRPTNIRSSIEIEKEKERMARFSTLWEASNNLQDIIDTMTKSVIQYTEHDPILLSLLLIIGLFSPTLSLNLDEPLLENSSFVYHSQALYTKVLWNYIINKHGQIKACQKFLQLITILFRVQLTSVTLRKFIREQMTALNTVDKITELMQTVLHIY